MEFVRSRQRGIFLEARIALGILPKYFRSDNGSAFMGRGFGVQDFCKQKMFDFLPELPDLHTTRTMEITIQ